MRRGMIKMSCGYADCPKTHEKVVRPTMRII